MAGELETFLAAQQDNERQVPGFIEKEFRSFLDCGVLARGFLRIACNTCRLDRVVAFSCYPQWETISSCNLASSG